MIFASDLDRTLIYSSKFLNEKEDTSRLQVVETKEGRPTSYMTSKSVRLLHDLVSHAMFLPVTTRNIEQYHRISIFQTELMPEYAITCNGGVILKNGKPDQEWEDCIRHALAKYSAPLEYVFEKMKEMQLETWVHSLKKVENLFLLLIISPSPQLLEKVEKVSLWAEENGWFVSLHGRKLYVIPKSVNKWDAVQYVREKTGKKTVYTAGDSDLDLCLIEGGHFGIIPKHGDTAKKYPHFIQTVQEGMIASEEILETILSKIQGS
jgi:hypothetical protein